MFMSAWLQQYYGLTPPVSVEPDEVTYHFIKGHGWVPETTLSKSLVARQAAKVPNFGWALDFGETEARIFEQADRDYIGRQLNRVMPEYYRVRVPVTAYTNTPTDDQRYFIDDPWANLVTQRPRAEPVQEPPTQRYYPGANEPAEDVLQENQHVRRARESGWRQGGAMSDDEVIMDLPQIIRRVLTLIELGNVCTIESNNRPLVPTLL